MNSNTITFSLEKSGYTTLAVFDLQGRQVAMLVQGRLQAGDHRTRFVAGKLAAGVYVLKLVQDGKVVTKKLLKE